MMYGNQQYVSQQNQPEFKVKIYQGDNSISLTKTDSGLLNSIQNPKIDRMLAIANMKQFLSYHLLRMVSESFNYLDSNIYWIVNKYVSSLDILSFLDKNGGEEALKFNILAEIYKISELLFFYHKPLVVDMEKIKEEIGALVSKIFKAV